MAISVKSSEGQRLVDLLKREFSIPDGATRVSIDYEVNGLFLVSCEYMPPLRRADEIETTSLAAGAREYVAGVKA